MKVRLFFKADAIVEEQVAGRVAVVIDTLRATSTIITALANGATSVIPTDTIDRAWSISKNYQDDYLIAGERNGIKIEDFDLGNSPKSYTKEKVAGQTIILTTTNGTRCFKRLDSAREVLVASLINSKALANYFKQEEEIILCCAGVNGVFALDDFITAGRLIAYLVERYKIQLTDEVLTAYHLYLQNQNDLLSILKRSKSGQNLINLGKEEDIEYIINCKQLKVIPRYKDGIISVKDQY